MPCRPSEEQSRRALQIRHQHIWTSAEQRPSSGLRPCANSRKSAARSLPAAWPIEHWRTRHGWHRLFQHKPLRTVATTLQCRMICARLPPQCASWRWLARDRAAFPCSAWAFFRPWLLILRLAGLSGRQDSAWLNLNRIRADSSVCLGERREREWSYPGDGHNFLLRRRAALANFFDGELRHILILHGVIVSSSGYPKCPMEESNGCCVSVLYFFLSFSDCGMTDDA